MKLFEEIIDSSRRNTQEDDQNNNNNSQVTQNATLGRELRELEAMFGPERWKVVNTNKWAVNLTGILSGGISIDGMFCWL
jgi:hypothetical protein